MLSKYRNALDIKPYIEYANSPDYDISVYTEGYTEEKLDTITTLDSIVKTFGFSEDNLSKNLKILNTTFDNKEELQNLKTIMLDYTKQSVQDVDYWFIFQVLRDSGEFDTFGVIDKIIQDMMYMHWNYDDLIRNGEESDIVNFIDSMEPSLGEEEQKKSFRNALDIKPYLEYVISDEYVHSDKNYVIEQMNKVRDVLGFPGVQQGGQTGQYGGMWQRGGFFMTCS